MLESPSTLEGRPLLRFALRRLASGGWLDRVIFCALWPAGKLQTALMTFQDHFAALTYIRDQIKPAPRLHPEALDWSKLIAKVSETKPAGSGNVKETPSFNALVVPGSRDVAFRNDLNASPGWKNLELLLRVLARVHARPLILSMPIGGNSYDHAGISRSAREDYYVTLQALVQRYHFPLRGTTGTEPFLSVRKAISQQKAGCITIALLMISFMGVRREADRFKRRLTERRSEGQQPSRI